ncbi:unnamed protein product [Triticum turgidum subsp. durum]|uniref:Homeobox domain-containing protein n=1 Tax=Triticum turgidum subsp. durum TaxID=4567 RepID=A0A9R0T8P5_TRITD|nr:unnamed protein product [Triticum turgidum subsp. durum]
MATFFSTSNDQRGLAGGGGGAGDMSFHHHYPMSNQYPDSSTGGLIPLPASIVQQSHIAHGGGGGDGRDDEQAAFMGSRDGSELGGLQTQMLMGDGGASAGQRSHQGGLSLSLGGNGECDKVEGDKGEENEGSSAAELSPAERQDLQNKVTALMAMLDQVDRRYRHYHQQMQMVVSSFDAVAGSGAARPYTALALQTISRHFRSLRDAIGAQVQSARRSLGEPQDGSGAGGLSRLRYIDQHLRQQRAMQQFGMMQQPQHAWRPQRGLPESAVSVLRAWLFEHFLHPYPKDSEKVMLARQAGLSRGQVSNWFINARVRLWKPMVEEMYKEEFGAEMDSTNSSSENAGNKHSKVDEAACSEDQDRDEFQSTSTHAGASQLLNAYKSEPVGSMDAGPLSSFGGGDMGTYAPAGLSLNHHGPGGGSLLQDAFPHHGDDTRFVPYGGNMGDLGGSVSLTLGLQHCNNNNNAGHVPPEQQGLLYGNPGDFDFLNGGDDRQRFASSSSQLLHDFVT